MRTGSGAKADTDRDNFMSAEQAVAYGIVDHVLEKRGQLPINLSTEPAKS